MGVCNRNRRAQRAVGALWVITLVSAATGVVQVARAVAPLETYGRLPRLENVALSPDGGKIAFVRTDDTSRILAIIDLASGGLVGGTKVGEAKLRGIRWADNDHLMITTSTTGMPWGLVGTDMEWFQLHVFELSSRKLKTYPELARWS